jgi:hypothetical protein
MYSTRPETYAHNRPATPAEDNDAVANSKRSVVVGTGLAVVLTAISAALINELHGGWGWWVTTAVAVGISAVLASWLASRTTTSQANPPAASQVNIATGSLYAVHNGSQTIIQGSEGGHSPDLRTPSPPRGTDSRL